MLDADDGGRARRAQLIENNIPDDRILLLVDDTDIEIEDLIAPETYVHGVQRYLDDVGASETFTQGDLPAETCRRHETVQAWCTERQVRQPSKIVLANKIIDLAQSAPVLDPQRAESVRQLQGRIRALFER